MTDSQRVQLFKYEYAKDSGRVFGVKRAMYYLTYKCNCACRMCFLRKHSNYTPELTLEQIHSCFSRNRFDSLVLTGGEVFCRKDILDVLECLDSLTSDITLITNGRLVSKDIIKTVSRLRHVNSICFSVDGFEDVHDRQRGKGSFKKIVESIQSFRDKVRIIINIVIMQENVQYLSDLFLFFSSLGANQINYQFLMEYGRLELSDMPSWLKYNSDCVCTSSPNFSYLTLLNEQIDRIRSYEKRTIVLFRPELFERDIDLYTSLNRTYYPELYCTDILEPVVKILPDGEITLCEALNLTLGNILNDDVSSLLNSEAAIDVRKKILASNMTSLCCRCCSVSSCKTNICVGK